MNTRLMTGLALVALGAGAARGQHRLTAEVFGPIQKGVGRMTEDEVRRRVPGPFTVTFDDPGPNADYVMTWKEVCQIRVEFLDGKATATTGTFSDVAVSKIVTLENAKKIARGMKRADVGKLLTGATHFRGHSAKDPLGRDVQVCEWEDGREIRVNIKDGKVSGCAYVTPRASPTP